MSPSRSKEKENSGRAKLAATLAIGAGALVVGSALAAAFTTRWRNGAHPEDSAPARTAKGQSGTGGYATVGRTVTINKPRSELYAFWRDFRNLPTFMENVKAVRYADGSDHLVWTIAAPLGRTVELVTEVTEDRKDECISWRSLSSSEIDTRGRVTFRDAPGNRGTQVEAEIAYKPPGGELGRWIAKAFQREPKIQGRRELKRLKMLMETGEVATSRNRKQEET